MRFFIYIVLFFCFYTSTLQAQVNISYPQWQHPVLQQLRAGAKNLVPFYNKDSTSFITVSVIDNKQKIIFWFDCYGYYFDAVPIRDHNIQAIVKKTITAFKYYDFITAGYLKAILKARKNLQNNGTAAKFTAYEKQLLQIEDTLKFPSTLKKLIELDKQKLSVERQIREFYSISPQKIKYDSVFAKTIALPYGSMQTTIEELDTITTYYNRIALQPVYKAVLNHLDATITYFNRADQLIDELQINKENQNLLFTQKTDVFLLYRGWLEMQRFNIVESLANIKASEKQFVNARKNSGISQPVNTKNSFQSLLTYSGNLLKITDYKINYFTTIDRGFVSQCLKDQYRQVSNSLSAEEAILSTFARGNKVYELTDARGNIMAGITDKKNQHSSNGATIDYYEPDIAAATDYAPFGGALPGRNYQSDKYRYGFNGKENDSEVKGQGNQQDYGMRIYDPRLGRFLSVDPISKEYPELTPYQFASNTPIQAIDLDGLEAAGVGGGVSTTQLQSTTAADQTGKGIIAMGKGFVSSAKNTLKGTWNAIKDPKQAGKNIVNAVSNPVKTWKGVKSGVGEWGDNLMSKNPSVSGFALGQGFEVGTKVIIPVLPIVKGISKLATKIPSLSGKFIIGYKTLERVKEHLEFIGFSFDAGNQIMLSRMGKIANKEMKATEIDINFAKHELREAELMRNGKSYEDAHTTVLKEQGMGGMNVAEYEKKLYTQDALDASNAAWEKEIMKK